MARTNPVVARTKWRTESPFGEPPCRSGSIECGVTAIVSPGRSGDRSLASRQDFASAFACARSDASACGTPSLSLALGHDKLMEQASESQKPDAVSQTGAVPPRIAVLRDALPRWRARIFWSFQVLFWLAIAAAVLGLSRAVEPTAPTPWLAIVLRVGTGFVISTIVYLGFESARMRGVPRGARWPLMIVVSLVGLGVSVLLVTMSGVSGPTIWSGARIIGLLVPRIVTTFFWCASIFGLEMLEDLYKTEILLAENEASAIDLELRTRIADLRPVLHAGLQLDQARLRGLKFGQIQFGLPQLLPLLRQHGRPRLHRQ